MGYRESPHARPLLRAEEKLHRARGGRIDVPSGQPGGGRSPFGQLQEEVFKVVGHRPVAETVAAGDEIRGRLPGPRAAGMLSDQRPPRLLGIGAGPPLDRRPMVEPFSESSVEDRAGLLTAEPQEGDSSGNGAQGKSSTAESARLDGGHGLLIRRDRFFGVPGRIPPAPVSRRTASSAARIQSVERPDRSKVWTILPSGVRTISAGSVTSGNRIPVALVFSSHAMRSGTKPSRISSTRPGSVKSATRM
jgi:hypothetical protein